MLIQRASVSYLSLVAPMSRRRRTFIEKWLDNDGSVVKRASPLPISGGRMSRRISISAPLSPLWPSVIRAFLLALALTVSPGGAGAADKLVLQLHRAAQFEFAGYYAALWQGFYRETGLEVEIKPGAPPGVPPIDPVREIVEGRAQFGTGSVQLLIRAAQGQSLLLLAPIFQQSDARVYYRADGDFSSPGALLNGRIGRLPPSNTLDLELRTALYAEAIDPDTLRSLSSEPGQALTDLASHRVDAAAGSVWELPWQAREQGVALKSFNPAGYRVDYYGDSLFSLQRLAKTNPALVQRFREASVKGWGYALQHSDEIARRVLAELPIRVAVSDPAGFTRYQTEVARELARYPDVPLGHSNPERWDRIQQSLTEIGEISRPADLDAFLYHPDAAPRSRSDGQATIAAVASAVALLASAGFLWWHVQGRRAASAGAAIGDTKPPDERLARPATAPGETRREFGDRVTMLLDQLRGHVLTQSRLTQLRAAASRSLNPLRMLGSSSSMQSRVARWRGAASEVLSRLVSVTRRITISSGGSMPGPRPTNLNAALTTLERSIGRWVPDNVKCRFSLLPDPWRCDADPDAVAVATLDLVAAAVAEMPAGGDLIIGTRQYTIDDVTAAEFPGSATGDYVRLTVKDDGPGLIQERLDRIFDPAQTARPAVAAASELTRRLGGFARVESAEGIGTAVHLYFRRAAIASVQRPPQPPDDHETNAAAA
jgi:ABC-type nitrate/sulfonate/bicarbonate transport system substrate-binding protein/signal transduction histidine kinase